MNDLTASVARLPVPHMVNREVTDPVLEAKTVGISANLSAQWHDHSDHKGNIAKKTQQLRNCSFSCVILLCIVLFRLSRSVLLDLLLQLRFLYPQRNVHHGIPVMTGNFIDFPGHGWKLNNPGSVHFYPIIMPVNMVLGYCYYTAKSLKYNLIDLYPTITATMGHGEPFHGLPLHHLEVLLGGESQYMVIARSAGVFSLTIHQSFPLHARPLQHAEQVYNVWADQPRMRLPGGFQVNIPFAGVCGRHPQHTDLKVEP